MQLIAPPKKKKELETSNPQLYILKTLISSPLPPSKKTFSQETWNVFRTTLKKGHLWEGITVVGEELVIQRVGEQVGGFQNELHAGF